MFRRALLVALLFLLPSVAMAAPMQSGVAPPVRAGFLPVAAEIGQQIQALVTGDPATEIEPQETFGTRALGLILETSKLIATDSASFISNFAALPQLATWFNQQVSDPTGMMKWSQTGQMLLLILAIAFAAGWLADLVLLPLRKRAYRKEFSSTWARFGAVFGWLCLSFIPVIVFVASALYMIDYNDQTKLARFIIMTVIYALAIFRLLRVVLRFFLAPKYPKLRVLPISTSLASYVQVWASWFGGIMILRYYVAEIARLVKVPAAAISGFTSSMALVVVVITIVALLQKRSAVSSFIRGDLSAAQARASLIDSLRLWLARTWHVLAVSYLVIGYFVTMLGADGGFVLMQQGTIGTLLVLLLMRLSFFFISRLVYQKRDADEVSGIYRPILRFFFKMITWVLGVAIIAASWGVDVGTLFYSAWGQRIFGSFLSISSTILALVFVYEIIHAAIERKLNRRDSAGNIVRADARSLTLLPMVRNAAIVVLGMIASLVTLSELGINTAPLLAGAGVLGVALGFGSQTLVKDFLTGLFIIIENTIAVGDIVKLGEHAGVVEGMTIRTVRLRDAQGALHIVPFSEISRIVNMSKGFAYALMDIGVAYDSDLRHVMDVMQKVSAELQKDPAFRYLIIEPMEMLGVEEFGDSSITIRCRIKTLGGKQWDVRRAYLLRLKEAFDKERIEIPFPHVVHIVKAENPADAAEVAEGSPS